MLGQLHTDRVRRREEGEDWVRQEGYGDNRGLWQRPEWGQVREGSRDWYKAAASGISSLCASPSVFLPPYSVAQKAKECGEEPGGFLAIEAAELKAKGKA